MEIVEIKCPNCQGNIHITAGRKETYCEFCGSHLFFDDGNRVITNVNIIRDETELKKLDIIDEHIKRMEKQQKFNVFDLACIGLVVLPVIVIIILGMIFSGDNSADTIRILMFIIGILTIISFIGAGLCGFRYYHRHKYDVDYKIK